MNVSDSELVETLLIKQGYQKVDHPDKADIFLLIHVRLESMLKIKSIHCSVDIIY